MAVQARTLEIYSKMGIIDQALALGARGTAANMWVIGQLTARIPIGDIGKSLSLFPFILMLGQDDNERIMGEKLRSQGVDVQWNTELIALEQQPDHVVVTLKQPNGSTRKLSTSWVAGCDGSHSCVREMSGITFPGAPYEHVFFVADTEATGSMKPGELNVYLWRDGFHLFFPMIPFRKNYVRRNPGRPKRCRPPMATLQFRIGMRGKNRWRVIGILPENMRNRADLMFDELVPALRQEAGANL